MNKILRILTIVSCLAWTAASVPADEAFHCEVLSMTGIAHVARASGETALLKEGDLLSEGDSIEVSENGTLDLAYDKEWNNVVHLEKGAKAKVESISPAKLGLNDGAVYARLKKLPATSSFDVQTPTAVAAVRGTEYRTVVHDGQTEIFNFSSSKVFVYGVDEGGHKSEEPPAVLESEQKTSVESAGEPPKAPQTMETHEKTACEVSQKAIVTQVERAVTEGRIGKIQTVTEIESTLQSRKSKAQYDEESRVTDTRRRSFK